MTGKGESMQLFNINYIHYDKAFEISILIDIRLHNDTVVENKDFEAFIGSRTVMMPFSL